MAPVGATGSSAYCDRATATHLDESLHKIRLAIRLEWEWVSEWWYAERRVPIHVARQGRVQLRLRVLLRTCGRITRVGVHSSGLRKPDGDRASCCVADHIEIASANCGRGAAECDRVRSSLVRSRAAVAVTVECTGAVECPHGVHLAQL